MNDLPVVPDKREVPRSAEYALAIAAGLTWWGVLLPAGSHGKEPQFHYWLEQITRLGSFAHAEHLVADWVLGLWRLVVVACCLLLTVLPLTIGRIVQSIPMLRAAQVLTAVGFMNLIWHEAMGYGGFGNVVLAIAIQIAMAVLAYVSPEGRRSAAKVSAGHDLGRGGLWPARLVLIFAALCAMAAHGSQLVSWKPELALEQWRILAPMAESAADLNESARLWRWIVYLTMVLYAASIFVVPWVVEKLSGTRRLWVMRVWATLLGGYALWLIEPYSTDEPHHWVIMEIGLFGLIWINVIPWSSRVLPRFIQGIIVILLVTYLFGVLHHYAWRAGSLFIAIAVWLEVLGLFLIPSGRVGKKVA
jgi:hypothetical protein